MDRRNHDRRHRSVPSGSSGEPTWFEDPSRTNGRSAEGGLGRRPRLWMRLIALVSICMISVAVVVAGLALFRMRLAGVRDIRAGVEYSRRLRHATRRLSPTQLEYADGYHPVGEVPVTGKRGGDHAVLIVKAGAVSKYVCWTTGSPHRAALVVPGITWKSYHGSSVTVSVSLRHRATVVEGTPHISASGVVRAIDAGLVANGVTDNTARLNDVLRMLPSQGRKTLVFPRGHFAFTGVIDMVSDLTMRGTSGGVKHGTVFQMPRHRHGGLVIWYPTGGASGYDGMHDVTWSHIAFYGGHSADLVPTQTIYQPLIHARDIVFDHCVFEMVQRCFGHVLDVDGSTGVTVTHSTVIGSANRGQTFKEAFQMDVAALGASGYYDRHTVFNNLPTTHMTIEHSRFLPLRDSQGRLLLPAAAPFGTHMAYAKTTDDSSYIRYGVFRDNYVEDPVSYEGAGTENSAVIHFDAADDITITGNTFVWTGETRQSSWAVAFYARSHRMVKPRQWHGITITDNVFRGFAPRMGVFDLYRESDSIDRPGGATVTRVVVRRNSFEGTPIGLALRWLGEYSSRFLVTYGHDAQGSDNVVDEVIHLDGTSSDIRAG